MRAIDANVLVRLVTRDHAAQTQAAEKCVADGAWVSQIVLAEAVWVLGSIYGLPRDRLADAIEGILGSSKLVVQDADAVSVALQQFVQNKRISFSDCLIREAARRAGHTPMFTFDRQFAKVEGVERLS